MKVAILIASRNRPDLVDSMVEQLTRNVSIPHDIHVVECGTDPDRLSKHSTIWYADPDSRGTCWGHDLALHAARSTERYDYVWVLMNDLVFEEGTDPLARLIETMESEPRMGILSPTNVEGGYPAAAPRAGGGWRKVTTCDYLGFLMRTEAVDECGFLDPTFQYCVGAIHELSYKLYSRGWFVAYSDDVAYRQLGGSTYGRPGTGAISRDEYQLRAKRAAYTKLAERYGSDWHERFSAATAGHEIEIDTFREHRALWATAFSADELAQLAATHAPAAESAAQDVLPNADVVADPDSICLPVGRDMRVRAAVGAPASATEPAGAASPAQAAAWELSHSAPHAILAWPDYGDDAELDVLFSRFGRPLQGSNQACLCLRFDASVDGSETRAITALQSACERTLGPDADLEVLLVDDELRAADLPRLGAALRGVALLPSSAHEPRAAFLTATGAPLLRSVGDLCTYIPDFRPSTLPTIAREAEAARAVEAEGEAEAAREVEAEGEDAAVEPAVTPTPDPDLPLYEKEVLDTVAWDVVDQIASLHPWSYPCVFRNLAVAPGKGTGEHAAVLERRTACRELLLVDGVAGTLDPAGKSLLDLGSDCGYFAARLAERGVVDVTGVDRQSRSIAQAELYWSTNEFLPVNAWRFHQADLTDRETWETLGRDGARDITLVTDVLNDLERPFNVLTLATALTKELLVIDVRIAMDSKPTSGARRPLVLAELLDHLGSLELGVDILSVPFDSQPGVDGEDDYALGRRVVLLAHKQPQPALPSTSPAARRPNAPLPALDGDA